MTDPGVAYACFGGFAVLAIVAYRLGRRFALWTVPVLALLIGVTDFALDPLIPVPDFPILYVAYSAAPLLLVFFLGRGWEGSRWADLGFRWDRRQLRVILPLSVALVGLYLLLTMEAGFVLGFQSSPLLSVSSFALYFLTAPLLALGEEALFRGYLLSRFSERMRLPVAVFLSGGLFAIFSFDPFFLGTQSWPVLGRIFFTTVVVNLLIGVLAGIYFYKADWSLLGPWSFRTGILWASFLIPATVSAAWPTLFVFDLIGLGACLALLYAALEEPRYQARHYLGDPLNPRRRTLIARVRARRETVRTGVAVVVAAAVLLIAAPPLFRSDSAPVRFEAIATGSMVPTLEVGTLVVVTPIASASDIHTGEIVAYNAPYLSTTGPVVHRVIGIRVEGGALEFTFKGDHNPSPDPRPVRFDQVVGLVVASVPVAGYFALDPALGLSVVAFLLLVAIYRSSPGGRSASLRRPILPLPGSRRP